MDLNTCLSIHATSLGITDYIFILGDKPERSEKEIDNLSFEDLTTYARLVKDSFESFKDGKEVQYKSLIEILTDSNVKEIMLVNFLTNAKYIVKLEFSARITIDKINAKIDKMKTLDQKKRDRIKMKLKTFTYNDITSLVKSKTLDNLLIG